MYDILGFLNFLYLLQLLNTRVNRIAFHFYVIENIQVFLF